MWAANSKVIGVGFPKLTEVHIITPCTQYARHEDTEFKFTLLSFSPALAKSFLAILPFRNKNVCSVPLYLRKM
jgi:hypothetical protein